MADERHNAAFMVGIILGAVGAGIATLLQTPLSGAQTREQLGVRLGGLRPSGVPTHLDQGSYGTLGRASAGGGGGGFVTALRERARVGVGAGEPGARANPAEDNGIARGEARTFTPAGFTRAPETMPRTDADTR